MNGPTPYLPDVVGIGIDFGMTFSGAAVAYQLPGGALSLQSVPILGHTGDPKFPTVVYVSLDRKTTEVGAPARAPHTTGKMYELFKRYLGIRWTDPDGIAPDVDFLVKTVLEAIAKDVGRYLLDRGLHDNRVRKRYVFTYPTTWHETQVAHLNNAIRAAHFTDFRLLDEAVATAIGAAKAGGYPEILGSREHIFVCDFGGGTTDFAVVQATAAGFIRMSHAVDGNPLLGMSNFDKAFGLLAASKQRMLQLSGKKVLAEHIIVGRHLEDAWGEYSPSPGWKSDLLRAAEAFKKKTFENWSAFSSDTLRLPDGKFIEITRAEVEPFKNAALEILSTHVRTYLATIQAAGVANAAIGHIVIGGGGSALPDIGSTLGGLMPRAKRLQISPTLATSLVQLGAACHGLNTTIYDRRFATSYGVKTYRADKPDYNVPPTEVIAGELEDGTKCPHYPYYDVFFKRNDIIRREPSQRNYFPLRSAATEVRFDVLNGEKANPLDNTVIGSLTLPFKRKVSRRYNIVCSFRIGDDGLLEVTATGENGEKIEKPFKRKIDLLPE